MLAGQFCRGASSQCALIEPEVKLGGIVEVDETWVGRKDANRLSQVPDNRSAEAACATREEWLN
jgi:hypothetical protein